MRGKIVPVFQREESIRIWAERAIIALAGFVIGVVAFRLAFL